jgi:hypothetical protein
MRYLAPLARAKREDCLRLADAIAAARLSTRQVGELYAGWASGSQRTREALLADPLLYLRAQAEARRPDSPAKSPTALLLDDLGLLGATARRAYRRLGTGALASALAPERDELGRAMQQAMVDTHTRFGRWDQETSHAGSVAADGDPRPA